MAKRMVNKQVLKGMVERTTSKLINGRWKTQKKNVENSILNVDHWKEWQRTDRNMADRATLRKSVVYTSKYSGEVMDSYTTVLGNDKVVYKRIEDPRATGEYRLYPE